MWIAHTHSTGLLPSQPLCSSDLVHLTWTFLQLQCSRDAARQDFLSSVGNHLPTARPPFPKYGPQACITGEEGPRAMAGKIETLSQDENDLLSYYSVISLSIHCLIRKKTDVQGPSEPFSGNT